ncbi:MAG: hypothetical protein ABSB70_01525 [Candidatus Velthaea sp.]
MTDISERRVVLCPEREAAHQLAAFVAAHRAGDGSVNIALRLPLKVLAAWKLPFERRGVASFYALQSTGDRHPAYSVTRASKDHGSPEFAGALAVESSPYRDCFSLVLAGRYQPPFGSVGALIDAGIGFRIAAGTARDLLRSIAGYIEHAARHGTRDAGKPREALPLAR